MDEEKALKEQFAAALLRNPNNAFRAAQDVFPGDGNLTKALVVMRDWPGDSFVIECCSNLVKTYGARKFLPTREDFARLILGEVEGCKDGELKLKMLRLFGDVMGYIEKPATTVNNNNNCQFGNRVMIVKDHGTNDDWEKRLAQQQAALTTDATAIRH